jgi:thioredoxin
MATVDLTEATAEETISNNEIVLIDWWAEWCGPCRAFAPVYDDAADQNEDIVFGKVDTEAEAELAAAAGIRSIPTLVIFGPDGSEVGRSGPLPQRALEQLVSQLATRS